MKRKKKSSIKTWLFVPLAVLAIMMFATSVISVTSLSNVNKEATAISDTYLAGITKLSAVQGYVKDLHTMGLSHIVATDAKTMISLVDSVRAQEDKIETALEAYLPYMPKESEAIYEDLQENFQLASEAISKMMALSADTQNVTAFTIANTELKDATDAMNADIDTLITEAETSADEARDSLSAVYSSAFMMNVVAAVMGICIVIIAIMIIQRKVIAPVGRTEKELAHIMDSIDNRQGDLTKRVSLYANDEIGALAGGINAFIERLQNILKTVTDSSLQMNTIAGEVTDSLVKSNGSVTELSAVTEELAATMSEVGRNAGLINENANAVSGEVNDIADRTNEISTYSKEMKGHADKMENTARSNMETTSAKVTEILSVLNRAIEESESVRQVNNLTEEILNIASETNLLALNASIEAARAGEAGRGFAVVATEISHLAAESQETANRIQTINATVVAAVENLAGQATGLVNYLKESILPDFESFVIAGGEYKKNASYIESVMEEFVAKTDRLNETVAEIAGSIDSISQAIDEGVNGVAGTADSMQTLAMEFDEVSRKMDENQEIAGGLRKETEIFVNL